MSSLGRFFSKISRNFDWFGGLWIILIMISFVYGIKISIVIFSFTFGRKVFNVKLMTFLTSNTSPMLISIETKNFVIFVNFWIKNSANKFRFRYTNHSSFCSFGYICQFVNFWYQTINVWINKMQSSSAKSLPFLLYEQLRVINPLMHNVPKWSTHFKNLVWDINFICYFDGDMGKK